MADSTKNAQVHTPARQYYRRQLPSNCIPFFSDDGKQIFKEAVLGGHMNCYFRLAAQFRTQDEPAYCGLSTLVMVLNSLEVDPGRLWKGPWRWYHEDMLDCCQPLREVKEQGINYDQFICLSYCNYLTVTSVRGDENMSEDQFREAVMEYTKCEDAFIVASYSRASLNQTGSGHYSPIGGYHPNRDLLLIMDVARFKYPPHWVPLKALFMAMKEIDPETGRPRGYMIMSRQDQPLPLLLFRISSVLNVTQSDGFAPKLKSFLLEWHDWLAKPVNDTVIVSHVLRMAFVKISELIESLPEDVSVLTTQVDIKCPKTMSCEHICACKQLLVDIESTEIFKTIQNNLNKSSSKYDFCKVGRTACMTENKRKKFDCSVANACGPEHFVTVLFLAWPYVKQENTMGSLLCKHMCSVMVDASDLLQNEIGNLKKQLETIIKIYMDMCKTC